MLLACGLLLLFRRRAAVAWLPLLLVAAGLTAGAVWAGVSGGIHPLLWVLLFFGLAYVTVVALREGAPGDAGGAPWQNRPAMSTSIFVGHAKPPSNTVSGQMYTILSVVCEVDMDTGVIVAAEFTVATELAKDYLNRLLAGRNLSTDEDAIVAELEKCYFSGTQKALIQCFRDMAKRYRAQVGAEPAGCAGPAGRLTRRLRLTATLSPTTLSARDPLDAADHAAGSDRPWTPRLAILRWYIPAAASAGEPEWRPLIPAEDEQCPACCPASIRTASSSTRSSTPTGPSITCRSSSRAP